MKRHVSFDLLHRLAPVPAQTMHFRNPRRSTPSWLWSCRSSSFFFSDIPALLIYYGFYPFSRDCACRWEWRRGMGLSAPPLNVLAFIQTVAAPVLFQVHPSSRLSLHVRHKRAIVENK